MCAGNNASAELTLSGSSLRVSSEDLCMQQIDQRRGDQAKWVEDHSPFAPGICGRQNVLVAQLPQAAARPSVVMKGSFNQPKRRHEELNHTSRSACLLAFVVRSEVSTA